jgi:hypothetical protein
MKTITLRNITITLIAIWTILLVYNVYLIFGNSNPVNF